MATTDVNRAQAQLHQEKVWVRRRMAGDQAFDSLKYTHRDYVCVNRSFVVWTIVDGKPVIKAALHTDSIELTAKGLAVKFVIVRPGAHGLGRFFAMPQPAKVEDLDLFMWIPAFCDLHYIPFNYSDPESPWRISVSIMVKSQGRPDKGQEEGCSYFASKKDFVKYWPEFA